MVYISFLTAGRLVLECNGFSIAQQWVLMTTCGLLCRLSLLLWSESHGWAHLFSLSMHGLRICIMSGDFTNQHARSDHALAWA